MNDVAELRQGLRLLGARRRRARLVDAMLVCAVVAVVAGLVYYQFDRRWMLDVGSRLLLNVVALGVAAWPAWRYLLPAAKWREDEIAAAIRFEREHGLDADLVAALQFADVARHGDPHGYHGSPELRSTVVAAAASRDRDWNFAAEPTDRAPASRRLAAAVVVLFAAAVVVANIERSGVFVRRVLLGSDHYPSDTRIESLTAAGRPIVFAASADAASETPMVVVPQHRPVVLELGLGGRLPEFATVEVSADGGDVTALELKPTGPSGRFQGTLPPLVETVTGRIVAGDAYTEPFQLVAAPLPSAMVTLEVRPPSYALTAALEPPPPGRLQASVLEGSDVAIRVTCANKSLRQVVLKFNNAAYELPPIDEARRVFRFEPGRTALASIRQPIDFEVELEDADGFRTAEPIRGAIALRPDQAPTVSAEMVTTFVLPAGKPSLAFRAADDLGLQSLLVRRSVQRVDGSTGGDTVPIPLSAEGPRTHAAGRFSLDLSSLQLHKGDKVTLRLEARDRVGDEARPVAQSEPLTVEVTDEQGLYSAMAETDQRSALKMDEIIQKQLLMTGRGPTTTTTSKPPPAEPAPPPAVPPSPAKP